MEEEEGRELGRGRQEKKEKKVNLKELDLTY